VPNLELITQFVLLAQETVGQFGSSSGSGSDQCVISGSIGTASSTEGAIDAAIVAAVDDSSSVFTGGETVLAALGRAGAVWRELDAATVPNPMPVEIAPHVELFSFLPGVIDVFAGHGPPSSFPSAAPSPAPSTQNPSAAPSPAPSPAPSTQNPSAAPSPAPSTQNPSANSYSYSYSYSYSSYYSASISASFVTDAASPGRRLTGLAMSSLVSSYSGSSASSRFSNSLSCSDQFSEPHWAVPDCSGHESIETVLVPDGATLHFDGYGHRENVFVMRVAGDIVFGRNVSFEFVHSAQSAQVVWVVRGSVRIMGEFAGVLLSNGPIVVYADTHNSSVLGPLVSADSIRVEGGAVLGVAEATTYPTSVPTAAPTASPTAVPNAAPTAPPSAQSSGQPSGQPSGEPTSAPSDIPTSLPTSAPTISAATLWGQKASELVAFVSDSSPNTTVALFPLVWVEGEYLDSEIADKWSVFLTSTLPVLSALQTPTAVEILTVSSLETNVTAVRNSNTSVTCEQQSALSALLDISSLNSTERVVVCGDHSWYIRTGCSGIDTQAASFCVDCAANTCDEGCSAGHGSHLFPAGSQCSEIQAPGGVSFIQLLVAHYKLPDPAPSIVALSAVPGLSNITVTVELSDSGTVFCEAIPATALRYNSEGRVQFTGSLIPYSSRSAVARVPVVANTTAVTMAIYGGLSASTNHRVFCFTRSSTNIGMSQTEFEAQPVWEVETSCCKSAIVAVGMNVIAFNQQIPTALTISLSAPPSERVTFEIAFDGFDDDIASELGALMVPNRIEFTNSTLASDLTQVIAFNGYAHAQNASGWVDVVVTGSSASEYQLNFQRMHTGAGFTAVATSNTTTTAQNITSVLLVTELSATMPSAPPALISAIFAGDGTHIIASFDIDTDQMRNPSTALFTCCTLFSFQGCAESSCWWVDKARARIYPVSAGAVGASVAIGDNITLVGGQLRAYCDPSVFSISACQGWPHGNSTTVWVAPPESPVTPTVVITAPSSVGACSGLLLTLQSSTGSGGRAWASSAFTVAGSAPSDSLAVVESFLNSQYVANRPVAVSSDLLVSGTFYVFTVQLCSFLGSCGIRSSTVVVLGARLPSIVIAGGFLRNDIRRSDPLEITASTFMYSCGNASAAYARAGVVKSSKNLKLTWEIYELSTLSGSGSGGVARALVPLESTSTDPSVFRLAEYSLHTGTMYEVSLSVLDETSRAGATSTVTVSIAAGDLVARLEGGSRQSIPEGGSLVLDAQGSVDSDWGGAEVEGSVTNPEVQFAWTCKQTAPVFSVACPFRLTHSETGVVALEMDEANDITAVGVITVTVYDSVGRVSSTAVTVNIVPPLMPKVTIQAPAGSAAAGGSFPASRQLRLHGQVTVASEGAGAASWSWDTDTPSVATLTPKATVFNRVASSTTFAVVLVLAAGALPTRTAVTFTLVGSGSGDNGLILSASASVVVYTAAPPVPGTLVGYPVGAGGTGTGTGAPAVGTELLSTFMLVADRWTTDSDLSPLRYEFGFISSVGAFVPLQGISYAAVCETKLPAGDPARNFSLPIRVIAYDRMNGYAALETVVQVLPLAVSDTELGSITNSQLEAAGGTDAVVQVIGPTTEFMNIANCSLAPASFCAALHRSSCGSVAHTCGPCLSINGFVGIAGYSNTICLSDDPTQAPTVAPTAVEATLLAAPTPTELLSGIRPDRRGRHLPSQRELSLEDANPLSCDGDCFDNGVCVYYSVDSGDAIHPTSALADSDCVGSSSRCVAQCVCSTGYYGQSCLFTEDELVPAQEIRTTLLFALLNLTKVQNINEVTVSGWIGQLNGLTQTMDEIDPEGFRVAVQIATNIVHSLTVAGVTVDVASEVLVSLDRLLLISTGATNSLQSLVTYPTAVEYMNPLLQTYTSFVTSQMSAGQSSISSIQRQFRTSSITSAIASGVPGEVSTVVLETELSSLEAANGEQTHTVQIQVGNDYNLSNQMVELSVVVTRSGLYEHNRSVYYHSNPMNVLIKALPCTYEPTISPTLCHMDVRIPHYQHVQLSLTNLSETGLNYSVECNTTDLATYTMPCGNGYIATAECTGLAGIYFTRCPHFREVPTCAVVFGDSSTGGSNSSEFVGYNASSCTAVNFTAEWTHCQCQIPRTAVDSTSVVSQNFVGVMDTIAEGYVQTFTPYTGSPSGAPSSAPTSRPSRSPVYPTGIPSGQPSGQPSGMPSSTPSIPTNIPTASPSTHASSHSAVTWNNSLELSEVIDTDEVILSMFPAVPVTNASMLNNGPDNAFGVFKAALRLVLMAEGVLVEIDQIYLRNVTQTVTTVAVDADVARLRRQLLRSPRMDIGNSSGDSTQNWPFWWKTPGPSHSSVHRQTASEQNVSVVATTIDFTLTLNHFEDYCSVDADSLEACAADAYATYSQLVQPTSVSTGLWSTTVDSSSFTTELFNQAVLASINVSAVGTFYVTAVAMTPAIVVKFYYKDSSTPTYAPTHSPPPVYTVNILLIIGAGVAFLIGLYCVITHCCLQTHANKGKINVLVLTELDEMI